MADEKKFTWIEPYEAIATALRGKRGQETHLLGLAKDLCDMGDSERIDPLTFMAIFNRGQKDETRTNILASMLQDFGIDAQAPVDYTGLPVVNPQKWRYMDGVPEHIDEKWDFFEVAMAYAEDGSEPDAFAKLFDAVLAQKNIGLAKLTMALFWCRPDAFLPLDAHTVTYLGDAYFVKIAKSCDGEQYLELLKEVRDKADATFVEISAAAYEYDGWGPLPSVFDPGIDRPLWGKLVADGEIFTPAAMDMLTKMMELGGQATCKELAEAYGDTFNHYTAVGSALGERIAKKLDIEPRINQWGGNQHWSIPFLGKNAEKEQPGGFIWKIRPELLEALEKKGTLMKDDQDQASYWVYSPGEGACIWYDCVMDGIMALGWDQLGDFDQYASREELDAALADKAGDGKSQPINSLACWEFQSVMKPGDIVYAKRGRTVILGKGVVKSGPFYDEAAERYKHVRKVEWTAFGEWEMDGLPRKTLTCWDDCPDEVKRAEDALFGGAEGDAPRSYWWLVGKPSYWSFDHFDDHDYELWTAYNDKGNKRRIFSNMQSIRKGDKLVGYHSYPTQETVCTVEALSDFMGLGTKKDQGFWIGNRVSANNPVTYEQMKDDPVLCGMEYLVGNPTGCCFKLTEEQYERLISLMGIEEDSALVSPHDENYTDEDFLSEVFMEREDLEGLKALARVKKNVILQGAPGTGKTFAAERLAWALMGCKDRSRIEHVQFHQSTSYDEFVIGFRPNAQGGFEVKEGPFVRFCQRAAADPEGREYFFIIDEINRANVSKVFGELLMLIEADHRGEELRLAIDDRLFTVPKNVTIIGMMNTADRGLALIDYALRRRFAFFEMEPALGNANFLKMVDACPDNRMPALVDAVRKLNEHIASDPSLDEGFRIGHSYFCRSDEGCVDAIIKYELAPLIREYWFDDRKKAADEIKALEAAAK